jgi:hypothetical protein
MARSFYAPDFNGTNPKSSERQIDRQSRRLTNLLFKTGFHRTASPKQADERISLFRHKELPDVV